MYNLTEYSDNYSKISGILLQKCREELFIKKIGLIIDVPNDRDSASFKPKWKAIGQTGNDGTKDVQIMIQVKKLRNSWRNSWNSINSWNAIN